MAGTWNEPPADLRLAEACVEIWQTRLDVPERDIEQYLSILSTDEVARARRFRPAEKYREYVVTRGRLRRVLGRLLDRAPGEIHIGYGEHGKPGTRETWQGRGVSFNVAHSGDRALIAVTLERPIGIDIEKVRSDVAYRKLAQRFFSTPESGALDILAGRDLAAAFFACWTRKEAFVKALGDGISFGLSEFSVSVDPHAERVGLITHGDPAAADDWCIESIDAGTGYSAALAVRGRDIGIRYWL